MPDTYTKEQIDEAKLWLTTNDTGDSYDQKRRIGFEAIILSALDTAEKERDALAAYAAKLEKAGDDMRESSDGSILHCDAIRDWDAARKEKP